MAVVLSGGGDWRAGAMSSERGGRSESLNSLISQRHYVSTHSSSLLGGDTAYLRFKFTGATDAPLNGVFFSQLRRW